MEMLANADKGQGQLVAVAEYEARIRLYKEQIGTGYIGIGKTLLEAKAAGVVPHGEWEDWMTRTTGLSARQAQRCMQAAEEIKDGSALARLEMSKALMLLGSGLDEEAREEIAARAADEGATVKQLREELKKAKLQVVQETGAVAEIREALKRAKGEKESLEQQMRATVEAYQKRMDQAEEDAYCRGMKDTEQKARDEIQKEYQGKINYINSERKAAEERIADLKARLDEAERDGSARWDEGYKSGANRAAQLEEEARTLRAELEAAEAREAKRAAQLEALKKEKQGREMAAARGEIRAGAPGAVDLAAAVQRFLGDVGILPQMGKELAGMSEAERDRIDQYVDSVKMWVLGMQKAMTVVAVSGSVG